MKPKEFDELIKARFDQGEFAYKPANWQKLAEQLEERPGKQRKVLLWLPLAALASTASIAASLAMIISIPGIWHRPNAHTYAHARKVPASHMVHHPAVMVAALQPAPTIVPNIVAQPATNGAAAATAPATTEASGTIPANTPPAANSSDEHIMGTFATNTDNPQKSGQDRMPQFSDVYPENYYAPPEKERLENRNVVSIAGGVNYGAISSGYTIGATGKHMINEHLYVEGEVAFVNTATTEKAFTVGGTNTAATAMPNAKLASAAKTTATLGITDNNATVNPPQEYRSSPGSPTENNYGIYYAQVEPSVGYTVMKHISVGVGADVQRLLEDTRPTDNDYVAENKVAPTYDLGVVGKTEYTLTSKLKAGIYYRQGLNNVISATNKYLDRSYFQVQLKYSILKK